MSEQNPTLRYSVPAALAALLLLVLAGLWLINLTVGQERQRALLQWESRLGLVADTRAERVGRLVSGWGRDLEELAGNASLQLYLGQLTAARAANTPVPDSGAAPQAYLRNLLLAAADRQGFLSEGAPAVGANLVSTRSSGLVLLDTALQAVVVTPGLQDANTQFAAVARRALATPGQRVIDLQLDSQDRPVVVLAMAVRKVLGAVAADGQAGGTVGVLLAVRSAAQDFYPILTRGPAFAEDSETLLRGQRDQRVMFLSPTKEGDSTLRRTVPLDNRQQAEAGALRAPDEFQVADNYQGRRVLQSARRVRGLPWVVAQQVVADQALGQADAQRNFLLTALSLGLLAMVAMAVAAWRHGSAVRARQQATALASQAERLQKQTDLLHTVTDNVESLTLLLDRDCRVLFTNRAMADALQSSIPDLLGRPLTAALGGSGAQELQRGIDLARQQDAAVHEVLRLTLGESTRRYQASFLPVRQIGAHAGPTLVVLSDVTALEQAQERQSLWLQRLVRVLASALDLHDPNSGAHAARTAEVADALGRELGLTAAEQLTLSLAATLANVGKIRVPAWLLQKPEPLTQEEHQLLRRHVEFGLELLKDLEFDGPVLETMAQKQELLDGSGYPRGLSGSQLTLPGRILAVANAFVALISRRGYRDGMTIDRALQELLQKSNDRYDRRVLAALFHVVENRRDWSAWQGSNGSR
jgi:HD-GYP domain-containing protein (c-di-GMP phosphodiesterase class II)